MEISKMLVVSLFALTATAHAGAKSHAARKSVAPTKPRSNSVVIDAPGDLPELAQRHSEGMFLHTNGSGQAFLYLEQDHGKTVAILDVSNPGSIREAGRQVDLRFRSVFRQIVSAHPLSRWLRIRRAQRWQEQAAGPDCHE